MPTFKAFSVCSPNFKIVVLRKKTLKFKKWYICLHFENVLYMDLLVLFQVNDD